jgi:hypothetical protein
MPCLCPATDGVFCYFKKTMCPSPYYWDLVVGDWGYCLTTAPTGTVRTVACIGDSLPTELAAAIQRSQQFTEIQIQNDEQKYNITVYGSIFGIIGFILFGGFMYYLWKTRIPCRTWHTYRAKKRSISNAEAEQHTTSLEILAMQRRPDTGLSKNPLRVSMKTVPVHSQKKTQSYSQQGL